MKINVNTLPKVKRVNGEVTPETFEKLHKLGPAHALEYLWLHWSREEVADNDLFAATEILKSWCERKSARNKRKRKSKALDGGAE